MTRIGKFFATPKRTILSCVCILAFVLICTGSVFAVSTYTSAIGAETAQSYAFADAGVDPADASRIQTEFDFKDGQFVYEVSFLAGGFEYDYWIRSNDGTVVKREQEATTAAAQAEDAALISLETAKETALADAGLSESEVTFTKTVQDTEDGMDVYEVEFFTDSTEYAYEINAVTGAIYSKSRESVQTVTAEAQTADTAEAADTSGAAEADAVEAQDATDTAQAATDTATSTTATDLEAAKAIALADAGLSADEVTFTKQKLDRDNGIEVYDIEFYTDTYEYDYEINAATGEIYSKDYEALQTAAAAPSSTYIGVDSAKAIAAADAGFDVSDVTFTKAKLDNDDHHEGHHTEVEYEIEFYRNGIEYEYSIDAFTGTILECDIEEMD